MRPLFRERGTVELYVTFDFVKLLARRYAGAEFTHGYAGEHRYKLTIQVNSWTGQ